MANVIPFTRRSEPVAFAPGVVPFDVSNPAHVHAWNSLFAFGQSQQAHNADHRKER